MNGKDNTKLTFGLERVYPYEQGKDWIAISRLVIEIDTLSPFQIPQKCVKNLIKKKI
jgi:hypothetical protein